MPEPNPSNTKAFATAQELDQWLRENHASETELWVKIFKKDSGIPSIYWDDLVAEILCWGWIDGLKKSFDDQAYLQRITPRKPKSVWSKRNRDHVERLVREGRMQEPGLVHVRAAQEDGRWENAYAVSEFEIPADFLEAVEADSAAKEFYETLNKTNRRVIYAELSSAKRPETRKKRFDRLLEMMIRGEKPAG